MAISPMKEAMLRALAYYKYLTVSHVLALSISKSKDKTAQYFRELQQDYGYTGRQLHYALIKDQSNPLHVRRTRQEYLWHLTVKGAKFLDSYTELSLADIRFPKRPKEYLSNDYFHRVSSIHIHLSFEKWMQKTSYSSKQILTYYNQYKDSTSKRFESETRIEIRGSRHFSPDLMLSYTTQEQHTYTYVLEVYNSNGNNRVSYVEEQLEKLFWILSNTKKAQKRTNIDTQPIILCTFDSISFMKGVLNRVLKNPYLMSGGIEKLLFFNLDRLVWLDFSSGWVALDRRKVDLETIRKNV